MEHEELRKYIGLHIFRLVLYHATYHSPTPLLVSYTAIVQRFSLLVFYFPYVPSMQVFGDKMPWT